MNGKTGEMMVRKKQKRNERNRENSRCYDNSESIKFLCGYESKPWETTLLRESRTKETDEKIQRNIGRDWKVAGTKIGVLTRFNKFRPRANWIVITNGFDNTPVYIICTEQERFAPFVENTHENCIIARCVFSLINISLLPFLHLLKLTILLISRLLMMMMTMTMILPVIFFYTWHIS